MGVSVHYVNFVYKFLRERYFVIGAATYSGSVTSEVFEQFSGVVQGSPVGPLLFSLAINSLLVKL